MLQRLWEWFAKEPSSTPFEFCYGCEGILCPFLTSESAVRQLLQGDAVPVYQGSVQAMNYFAQQGCNFAKCIVEILERSLWFKDRSLNLTFKQRKECGLKYVDLQNDGHSLQFLAMARTGTPSNSLLLAKFLLT
jgi:hypothetical protein